MAIFSRAEMGRRHEALRERMKLGDVDAVIATSFAVFYYLSGVPLHPFGRPMAVVIPLDGEPVIIEAIIDRGHTLLQSWIQDVRNYWDYNPTPSHENPHPPLDSLIYHLRRV